MGKTKNKQKKYKPKGRLEREDYNRFLARRESKIKKTDENGESQSTDSSLYNKKKPKPKSNKTAKLPLSKRAWYTIKENLLLSIVIPVVILMAVSLIKVNGHVEKLDIYKDFTNESINQIEEKYELIDSENQEQNILIIEIKSDLKHLKERLHDFQIRI